MPDAHVVISCHVLAGGDRVAVVVDGIDWLAVRVERIAVRTPDVVGDHGQSVAVGVTAHAALAVPGVAGGGRRVQQQLGAGGRVVAGELGIEMTVAADVDARLKRVAVGVLPFGHLEHEWLAARC